MGTRSKVDWKVLVTCRRGLSYHGQTNGLRARERLTPAGKRQVGWPALTFYCTEKPLDYFILTSKTCQSNIVIFIKYHGVNTTTIFNIRFGKYSTRFLLLSIQRKILLIMTKIKIIKWLSIKITIF